MPPRLIRALFGVVAITSLVQSSPAASAAEPLRVGFGKVDITPEVSKAPVWIAGYGNNRPATGIHDPIWSRAVVLESGGKKIALVSVDLIGLQLPDVERIRAELADLAYVLISSTHNHEGPDVIGLWGPKEGQSGVDRDYLAQARKGIVEAVRAAEQGLKPAVASYGTATDDALLDDSRLPDVKDGVLRAIRFADPSSGKPVGLLVQWNCHPENLGSKNQLITADFPHYTVKNLEARFDCPVAYFTGAVGGLMSAPEGTLKGSDGQFLYEGSYEFSRVYGEAVAQLASGALAHAETLELTPFTVSTRRVAIPLWNQGYRIARTVGVLTRDAVKWTGDPDKPGEIVAPNETQGDLATMTEVAYLRLGDLHIASIPGELYPELVYGQYQEPVEPNVDFPTAALEPPIMTSLPGPKTLLFGLANDEIGYLLPKRQWDWDPPFAYGRNNRQYGEVNSMGPEAGPLVAEALRACVETVRTGSFVPTRPSR